MVCLRSGRLKIALVVSALLVIGIYTAVQAFSRGYFTNNPYSNIKGAGHTVLPQLFDGGSLAIPINTEGGVTGVTSVDTFFTFLQQYNASSDTQKKTGSAYIVCTMLNGIEKSYQECKDDKYIDDNRIVQYDGWTELSKRLKALGPDDIDWNVGKKPAKYYNFQNSLYDVGNNHNDVYTYTKDAETNPYINFYHTDASGTKTLVYRLFRSCGNPIGGLGGLHIADGWSLSATSISSVNDGMYSAETKAAKPGDTIAWKHVLKNNGPSTTTYDIHSNIGALGGFTVDPKDADTAKGIASGENLRDFTTTYTVGTGDIGKQLCEQVNFTPSNSSNDPDGRGTKSCVNISAPVVKNSCDPIQIDVDPKTYPAVSYTSHGHSFYTPAETVPVNVITTKKSWNGISIKTPLIVTTEFTTGDQYTVSFVEQKTHVTGYTDVYVTNPDDPQYEPIYEPIYEITGYNTDGTPIYGSNIVGHTSNIIGHTSTIIGYGTMYSTSVPVDSTPGAGDSSTSIGPCYNFSLTAGVSPLSADYVESNSIDTVSVNPTVLSQSNTSKTEIPITHTGDSTKWQLTQLVIQPYAAFPSSFNSVGSSSSAPCDYYDPGKNYSCTVAKSGVGRFSSPDGNGNATNGDAMSPYSANIGDYAAGTKICFVFSVQPRAGLYESYDTDDRWSHSTLTLTNNCVVIVKKPKVQIWGGDLYANGGVSTSTSIKNIDGTGKMFGSWVEYGIFSAGLVKGAASGSAFADKGLAEYTSACNYSLLSFANIAKGNTSCRAEGIGYYSSSLSNANVVASVAASFPTTSSTPTVASNLDDLQGVYTAPDNVTINGGNIKKGKWVVINAPNATVTINGNITYTEETLNSIMDIPQVVIIAKNINITDNVTNVDSWLLASGNLNTCSSVNGAQLNVDAQLTTKMCDQKLTINGPVSAGKLYLRRTAGSGTGAASGDPAEVINLRADAYLWSAARATSIGKIHTVYTTELPPRF